MKCISQNVGIGTNQPNYPLTIVTNTTKGIVQNYLNVEVGFNTTSVAAYLQTWSNDALFFGTHNKPDQMSLRTGGQFGIGTITPSQRLDVNGTVRFRGGNPVAGAVLTSADANGHAVWTPPVTPSASKTIFIPYPAFVGLHSDLPHESVSSVSRKSSDHANKLYVFRAALLLPAGTKIKEITWHYFDNHPSLNLEFTLKRALNSQEVIAQTSSSGALNFDWQRTITVNHTLEEYFYWLDIMCFGWSEDDSLRFKGAMITYE